MRLIKKKKKKAFEKEDHPYKVEDSLIFYWVVHTHLFKDCVFMKTNLDNYNEIIYLIEHI
jgi:hypothetical protein